MTAYRAALDGMALSTSLVTGEVRSKRGLDPDKVLPLTGVYLLMLKGKPVYIGSSLNMPNRVAEHRTNGRVFDQAYYIGTEANQRKQLEATLIKAINPSQNSVHRAVVVDGDDPLAFQ